MIVFWTSWELAATWLQSCRVWVLELPGCWTLENSLLGLEWGRTAVGSCMESPGGASFRALKSWCWLWCLLPRMCNEAGQPPLLYKLPLLGIYRDLFLEVRASPGCVSLFMNFFLIWFVFWNTDPGFCLTWEHFPVTLNITISITFIPSHSCTTHTFPPTLPSLSGFK